MLIWPSYVTMKYNAILGVVTLMRSHCNRMVTKWWLGCWWLG